MAQKVYVETHTELKVGVNINFGENGLRYRVIFNSGYHEMNQDVNRKRVKRNNARFTYISDAKYLAREPKFAETEPSLHHSDNNGS